MRCWSQRVLCFTWLGALLAAWAGGAVLLARYVGHLQGSLQELRMTIDLQATEIRALQVLVSEVEQFRRSARERLMERRTAAEERRRAADEVYRRAEHAWAGRPYRDWSSMSSTNHYAPTWGGMAASDFSTNDLDSDEPGVVDFGAYGIGGSSPGTGPRGGLPRGSRRRADAQSPLPAPPVPAPTSWELGSLADSWADLYYGSDTLPGAPAGLYGRSGRAMATKARADEQMTPSRGSGHHGAPLLDPVPQQQTPSPGIGKLPAPAPSPWPPKQAKPARTASRTSGGKS